MAILAEDQVLCLPQRWQDCSEFTIKDETVYDSDIAGDGREDAARVMLAAKMTETQILTFIPLSNTTPLSTIEWTVTSSGDGSYRFFYFNILFYNVLTEYLETVIIYHNSVYYKAIGNEFDAIEPGVTSGWETYWEIFDITTLNEEIENTTLDIKIHDDIVTCAFENCILDEVGDTEDKILCGLCLTSEQLDKLLTMEILLDAANSNNWQQKSTRSEVILKEANKKYCNCGC